MELLNGKKLSEKIIKQISECGYSNYFVPSEQDEVKPKGVFIQVGDDYASTLYIKNKIKAMEACNFEYELYRCSSDISEDSLLDVIYEMNDDPTVAGIMVQLPLPKHIDEESVKNAISPYKDIDGFSIENLGSVCAGKTSGIIPATPQGILMLLHEYDINVEGKHVVVLGRSETVGRPIANLLSNKEHNATVTLCHSYTGDIKKFTKMADIVICAIGQPNFLTKDMIKKGAVIIDVGINRDSEGNLCGDCDASVQEVASYVTPVPGGVGPMTVASLMCNLLELHFSEKSTYEEYN